MIPLIGLLLQLHLPGRDNALTPAVALPYAVTSALRDLLVTEAEASRNLIPVALKSFPSELGGVESPLTAPGKTVRIRLNPQCDAVSPGFATGTPIVTLTFQPPGGGASTAVPVTPSVEDALTLSFVVPDTDADLPPPGDGLGLAGPARITVKRLGDDALLADIWTLYQPTEGCGRQMETIFQKFTVLPTANQVEALCDPGPGLPCTGVATRLLMTLDGGNNVLIPLNHLAILPLGSGAPVARFLSGASGVEAFSGSGQPVNIPAGEGFVRWFTLDGRPLPPLLRSTVAGNELYGTADAKESVLRIARSDGLNPDIYDFTDRLYAGKGPIVVDKATDGFSVTSDGTVPLAGLRSSNGSVAFARDEHRGG